MKKIYLLIALAFTIITSFAQVPTVQDCMGAIPLCFDTYSTATSYSGTGNYPNEINDYIGANSDNNCPNNCLLDGELNDVWYTFTVQTSGNVAFTISPVNTSDDYDWAVYNLTNANCSDILTNVSLQTSCNFCGIANQTGPNGLGGTNCQYGDPNFCSPYNAAIPVTAGEIYVVNVSNFSATQSGYTIDFGGSTAQIVDNTGPYLESILNSPACGQNVITVEFNENVTCASVGIGDFTVTGPGGPYSITSIYSADCALGATYSRVFELTLNQALTTGGTYTLNLVDQIDDICAHSTTLNSLVFTVIGVTGAASINNNVTCNGGANGSATASASGGTVPYSYLWDNGGTTATVNNLNAGTHYVTITDNVGVCQVVESVIITQPTPVISNILPDPASVCEGTAITFSGNASGGSGTYSTHLWTGTGSGYLTSTSTSNTTFQSTAPNGSYTLNYSVIDNVGCSGSDNITVTIWDAPIVSAGSGASTCGISPYLLSGSSMGGGASSVTWTTSGTGTYSNSNILNPTYTPSAADITSGTVTLTITTDDPTGPCTAAVSSMILTVYNPPTVSASVDDAICEGTTYTLSGTMGGGASNVIWTTSGTGVFSNNTVVNPTYTPSAADITAGSVTLTITSDDPAGPCAAASDIMTLTINPLDDAGFSYSQGTFCQTAANPSPSINTSGGAFSFSPAGLSINSSSGLIDLGASTIGGPYTITYTTSGTCPSSSTFDVTITSGFDAEFYFNGPYCTDVANPLPNHVTGSNGIYSSSPAGLVFVNTGTGEIDLTGTTPGTYTITNDIATSGGCAAASSTNSVTIYEAATIYAGTDDIICEGETYQLNNSSFGGSTTSMSWISSGTGTFDSNTLLHPLYTPSAADITAGSVTLTITTNDPVGPCGAVNDNLILTINSAPVVSANNDATICEGSTYTLVGSFGGGATGVTWSSSGGGTFDNSSLTNAVYTPSATDIATGSVTLTITTNDPTGPCVAASDQMILTINNLPTVNAGTDDVVCEGNTYTLSGSFGGGTSTVLWTGGDGTFSNPTSATSDYTPGTGDIAAGSVTLIITTDDPVGPCVSVSDNIILTINPAAIVSADIDDIICEGSTYTLNGSFGGGATNIIWTSSGTGTFDNSSLVNAIYTPSSTDITTGSVTLTITTDDPIGPCPIQTDNLILTINQAATVDAGADVTICAGDDYSLVGTYGGSANSITWTTSGDGVFDDASLSNAIYTCGTTDITNGSVILTITTDDPDASGPCSVISDNLTLNINPTPSIDSVFVSDVTTCAPVPPDGEIIIYASGGVAPLQYSINSGINNYTSNIFDSLNVGSYNIVVLSDVGLCDAILDSVIIIGSTTGPIIDSILVTNVNCNGGLDGEIEIFATGGLLYSIDNGISVYTDSTLYTGLIAGNYTVMVADAGNCIATPWAITITEPLLLEVNFTDSTNILCYGDNNGSVTLTPTGGTSPYTYLWDDLVSTTDSTINNLYADTLYSVTVTDNNGCELFSSISLTEPDSLISLIIGIEPQCYGNADGQAVVSSSGGTGIHYYQWYDNSTNDTITGLSANIVYYITTTDDNGCSVLDSITLTQPDSLTLVTSVTDATCGGSDGQAIVTVTGGTQVYQYIWEDATGSPVSLIDTANSLSYGTYYLTVVDANSCSDSLFVQINNQGGGTISIDSVNNVLCFGDNNGTIVATISNGTPDFTFYWSTIDTVITSLYTDTLQGLQAGIYTITVIDASGCQTDTSVTITGPTASLSATETVIDVSCYGLSDGQIFINASGGTTPYTYGWLPTGYTVNNNIYSGLPAGTYVLTLTDSNNCIFTIPKIDVNEPDTLTLSVNEFSPACYGDSTGMIQATIYGGTTPYNYAWYNSEWSNVITDSVLIGVTAGSYSLTVTDNHSCTAIEIATIYEPTEISVTITDTVEADYSGSVELTVTGGNPPYIFEWSNESTGKDLTGLETGIYVVTITDGNLCAIIDSVEIIIPLLIPTLFTPNNDGFNDYWRITNIDSYDDLSIEIYNRWGDIVFTFGGSGSEYMNNPWAGQYKGTELPMGSYVYIIDLKNDTDPISGVVSIKY